MTLTQLLSITDTPCNTLPCTNDRRCGKNWTHLACKLPAKQVFPIWVDEPKFYTLSDYRVSSHVSGPSLILTAR